MSTTPRPDWPDSPDEDPVKLDEALFLSFFRTTGTQFIIERLWIMLINLGDSNLPPLVFSVVKS